MAAQVQEVGCPEVAMQRFFSKMCLAQGVSGGSISSGYPYRTVTRGLIQASYSLIVIMRALYEADMNYPPANYSPETALDTCSYNLLTA